MIPKLETWQKRILKRENLEEVYNMYVRTRIENFKLVKQNTALEKRYSILQSKYQKSLVELAEAKKPALSKILAKFLKLFKK